MTVTISNEYALQLLEHRLDEVIDTWGNRDAMPLYMEMYESYVEGGCFEGAEEFNPVEIVDNDLVNYCDIVYKGDVDFEELHKLAEEGHGDISCENSELKEHYNFIEAHNDKMILVRW